MKHELVKFDTKDVSLKSDLAHACNATIRVLEITPES
jgi:hypothetical protein